MSFFWDVDLCVAMDEVLWSFRKTGLFPEEKKLAFSDPILLGL